VTPERTRADERLDIVATVLLALATVATAWSGYQASRWNGEQAKASGRTNAIRIEAARAQGLAQAQTQVDVATFSSWVDAYAHTDTLLAGFYFKRFRKEFKPAVEAWIATRPLRNPDAPLTPFVMPEYQLQAREDENRLDAEAELSAAAVRRDIQRSTNYVLAVVLFAAALFFAGMSAKLATPRLRRAMLALGLIVFVGTVAWLATFPVSVSV
jgi:TRAP-type C4-dicarboxylate transport system permease small subunit